MRQIALALVLAAAPAAVVAATLPVTMNEAVRVTLPSEAHDIIVGNPDIADVTVVDGRHLIVTGKKFGETNLIVTGMRGETIVDQQIVVPWPSAGRVFMFSGAGVTKYACTPECVSADEASAGAPQAPKAPQNQSADAAAQP